MVPLVTNGNSGNIGTNGDNDDPLHPIMIQWSYNDGNVDNNANGDNGFNGTSRVIGTNGIIEWRCVFHILHAPLHIEINNALAFGVIGAIRAMDTNGVTDANESPFALLLMDHQCSQWHH